MRMFNALHDIVVHRRHVCCADEYASQVVLEVKGLTQLQKLADKLQEQSVPHRLWQEQPENTPTALATAPLPKSAVAPHLKRLQLCKW